ncbi:MAG: MBL fold metallo-hydrolase [Deltaproteobacteria bacterium]|nr:MBL fold metallo-hydrolase [Deltaproteobacteria bacterium]
MEITFWGVRGAIPSPGSDFNRYGGNTSCVSVRGLSGQLVILDAGTGITGLGRTLMGGMFGQGRGRATLLLTHAHWDHIQGIPFFAPVYVPGNRFAIYGPSDSAEMMEGILEGQMNPHFSPVQSLRNLGAEIQFRATVEGAAMEIAGMSVTARSVPHGRISALAYRLEVGDASAVYVPDAGYVGGEPDPAVLELYRGATYLIHDCTYSVEDQAKRESRGYSSVAIAARVAARSQVRHLVMFHYDQDYTDRQVDELAARTREHLDREPGGSAVKLVAAHEGLTLRA